MSEEIKPVAVIKHEFGVAPIHLPDGTKLYAIPVTHRIVPVEMLERCSREFQSLEGAELAYPEHASAVQCYQELRAIIDKEST